MAAQRKMSLRWFVIIAVVFLVVVLLAGWFMWYRPNHCNDNGLAGYCCQMQLRKQRAAGKQPDYACLE
jgi:heme/copper-type cytochrome/quinol oxidase subunit 2